MPQDQLCIYVYNLSHQVMSVRCNGFSLLNAIDMVLYCDHNEVVAFNSMKNTPLGHLAANVKYY